MNTYERLFQNKKAVSKIGNNRTQHKALYASTLNKEPDRFNGSNRHTLTKSIAEKQVPALSDRQDFRGVPVV